MDSDNHNDDRVRPNGGLDVVVATIASDSHTWNLIFLELLLQEWGHRVTNLGPCVPDDILLAECRRRTPDLIVISSVNGHGFDEGKRVVRKLRECAEFASTPIVIGGRLGTGQEQEARCTADLLDAGFGAVFNNDADLDSFRRVVDAISVGARC